MTGSKSPFQNVTNSEMMSRALLRKIISVLFLVLSIVFLCRVIRAACLLGFGNGPGDWLITGLPLVMPAICALLSGLLFLTPGIHPVRRGLLRGAFVGGNGFLVLLSFSLFTRFDLISQDGTAYWGLLSLPCLFVGLPTLFIGGLVGLIAGLITKKRGTSSARAGLP
jgi:hypothetical protein